MSSKQHKQKTDHVEPDLPITPMLDMSFQLMAFFLITFRPMPTEGQIMLALPSKEGGGVSISDPLEDDKAKDVTVTVYSGPDGRIRKLEVSDATGTESLGADLKRYQEALKKAVAHAQKTGSKKVGKLKLEIEKNLLHEYVVQLLDIGVRAGFSDISPELLDEKKAGAGSAGS